jgi:hypothetical protein
MKITNYQYLINLLNCVPVSEIQLQSKCAELLYFFYPNDWRRLVTVFNNSLRANTLGFGIVPGVSDTYWLAEYGIVIFIEFKEPGGTGKQSKNQILWQALCERLGHKYYICWSEVTFWQIIGLKHPCEADIPSALIYSPKKQIG